MPIVEWAEFGNRPIDDDGNATWCGPFRTARRIPLELATAMDRWIDPFTAAHSLWFDADPQRGRNGLDVLSRGFAREYEHCRARVHELAAPLSDEAFWAKPFGFGNSFGHLVLHLTGNLSYYIGARVAQTGYVRTRDREFTEPERRPKADVLRDFDAAVDLVLKTIAAQQDEDWSAAYSGVGEPDAHHRFDIFLNCAMHFYHHVGQMVYLARSAVSMP